MSFDREGARAAGYSDAEIDQFLAAQQLQSSGWHPPLLTPEQVAARDAPPEPGVNWGQVATGAATLNPVTMMRGFAPAMPSVPDFAEAAVGGLADVYKRPAAVIMGAGGAALGKYPDFQTGYNEQLGQMHEATQRAMEKSALGSITGSVAALPFIPGLGAASGFVRAATTAPGALARAGLMGGAIGAPMGALQAAPDKAGMGALIGGGTGAALGVAIPAVAAGAGWVGQKVRPWFSSPQQLADDRIAAIAADLGVDAPTLANEIQRMGPNATLMDVEQEFVNLAARVRSRNPAAASILRDFLTERQGNAPLRAAGYLQDVGASVPSRRQLAGEMVAAKRQLRPGYEQLSKEAMAITPKMQELLDTPHARPAVDAAVKDWQTRNLTNRNPLTDGGVIPGDLLDRIKKQLDKRAEALYDIGSDSAAKASADVAAELRGKILTEASAEFPGYAATRRGWKSRVIEPREQFAAGQKAFTATGARADELADAVRKTGPAGQRAYKAGIKRRAERALLEQRSAAGTGLATAPLATSAARRQQLAMLAPDIPTQERFLNRLDAEQRFHEVYKMLNPNVGSKTQPLMEATGGDLASMSTLHGFLNNISEKTSPEVANTIMQAMTKTGWTAQELEAQLRRGRVPKEMAMLVRQYAPGSAIAGGFIGSGAPALWE